MYENVTKYFYLLDLDFSPSSQNLIFFPLQNHILGACKCFRCSFHLCFCFKLREILKVESPILLGSYTLNVSVFRCLCTLSKCPPCNCFLLPHDLQAMTIGMLLLEASPWFDVGYSFYFIKTLMAV